MAMDLNATWKSSFPLFTNDCVAVDITLAAATPTLLYPAIQAAVAALSLPQRSPKQVWLMAASGVTDVLIGTSANISFPLQHMPGGGAPHGTPFQFIVSEDRFGAFDGPALVSAAGGVVHCFLWA